MSNTKHLIFVNDDIKLDPSLIENSLMGSEVWTLDSSLDGLVQIETITSKYSNVDSIQIVSHGGDGSLTLGNITLSEENIASYSDVLGGIGESLSESGDVLLYGCNVASTENGEGFVLGLSKKLAADVGASIDLSGSKELGGDSDLEFETGKIETKTINDLDQKSLLLNETDFLNIDIEGLDYKVLKQIDLKNSKITLASIETHYPDGGKTSESEAIFNYLDDNKYEIYKRIGPTTLFKKK